MFIENLSKEEIELFLNSSSTFSYGVKIESIRMRKRTQGEGVVIKYEIKGKEFKVVLTDFEIFVPNILEIAKKRNSRNVESCMAYIAECSARATAEWRSFMATKFPYYKKNCDEYLENRNLIEKGSYQAGSDLNIL